MSARQAPAAPEMARDDKFAPRPPQPPPRAAGAALFMIFSPGSGASELHGNCFTSGLIYGARGLSKGLLFAIGMASAFRRVRLIVAKIFELRLIVHGCEL